MKLHPEETKKIVAKIVDNTRNERVKRAAQGIINDINNQ
jgi:hypothetical protein